MRKETVFTMQELRQVCIQCPHCGTQVILDMKKYKTLVVGEMNDRPIFAPRACPACKVAYDSAVASLDELQKIYAALSKLQIVTFRAESVDA